MYHKYTQVIHLCALQYILVVNDILYSLAFSIYSFMAIKMNFDFIKISVCILLASNFAHCFDIHCMCLVHSQGMVFAVVDANLWWGQPQQCYNFDQYTFVMVVVPRNVRWHERTHDTNFNIWVQWCWPIPAPARW